MTELIALFAVLATLFGAVLAAGVALYIKRGERAHAAEMQHSKAREAAYDRLLAAGDAAWYYRTLKGVDPDAEIENRDKLDAAIDQYFESACDQLSEHTRNFKAILPAIVNWHTYACQHLSSGPREFDNARDAIVDLRRQETGLREKLNRDHKLSFYDRFITGHRPQRLPEGFQQIMYFEDGGFAVQGAGGEFDDFMVDFIRRPLALQESRDTARRRLAEWREKGIWKLPPTENEKPDTDL